MATSLNYIERKIYNCIKSLPCYKRMKSSATPANGLCAVEVRENGRETDERLRKLAKLAAANPAVKLDALFRWWFGFENAPRPANLNFAVA